MIARHSFTNNQQTEEQVIEWLNNHYSEHTFVSFRKFELDQEYKSTPLSVHAIMKRSFDPFYTG